MNTMDGGNGRGERPDLDLDQPDPGDAQVRALFREGLRAPRAQGPDLRGIERRAKKKHRATQALASGAITAAAALAAVTVVVSPWSASGGEGVPAEPTPSVSPTPLDTTIPDVTQSSLLRTGDLSDPNGSVVGVDPLIAEGAAQDLSGEEWIGGVCVDGTFGVTAPERAWEQNWVSDDGNVPPGYSVTEQIAQWPGQPDQASAVLDGLKAQLAECTAGPGLEGRSVTTDRTDETELTVPHLAVTSEDGNSLPQAQVYAVWGDALVSVSVAVPASNGGPDVYSGNEDEAYTGAMTVLDNAIYRLVGRTPGDGSPSGLEPAPPETDVPYPGMTPEAELPQVTGTDSRTGDGQ